MFDMQNVGKTISALRKGQNMTQMELADRLGISFQAVSNWERGQTMPDIAKLGELAEIFGVTIDELLGNKKGAQVMEKLIRKEPVAEDLSAEEFLEVAPLVKPKQAEKLWENVREEVSPKDRVKAAPFLSEDTLVRMVRDAIRQDKSFDNLMGLMPFLSPETVDECVLEIGQGNLEIKNVIMAVPFMSPEALDRLADKALGEDKIADIVLLAPFMDKEKLTEAAAKLMETHGFSKVLPLMPFLDQTLLDTVVKGLWKKESHV